MTNFTSPMTAVADALFTAAQFNTNIRDNLNAIWVGTAAGDLDYYISAVAKARLAKGTARQVLRMNAAADAPEWGGAIAARVYRSTTQSISNNTWTSVSFSAEVNDTDNFWVIGSPTRLTIPYNGFYMFGFNGVFDPNATGIREAQFYLDGGAIPAADSKPTVGSGAGTWLGMSHMHYLTAAQYLEVKVYQNSGGLLNLTASPVAWIAFQGA